MQNVFSKFKGLEVAFNQATKDANLVKSNADWSEDGQKKRLTDIKDKLYLTYSNMLNEAVKSCDLGIKDKQEGYRICKLRSPKDDNEKLYFLQFYTGVVEKMCVDEIIEFMDKDNNSLNTVYRECFAARAESYKKDLEPLSGMSQKIDRLVSEINLENVAGMKDFQEMKIVMLNIINELTRFNWIRYKLEYEDINTHKDVTVLFNLEAPIKFWY